MDAKAYPAHAAVAVRSPQKILFHPGFWIHHLEYFAILAVALGLTGMFVTARPPRIPLELLTDPTATGLVNLVGGAFLFFIGAGSLWAFGAAATALAETMVDRSIAAVIEFDADNKLEELQRIPGARIDFGALRQLLPANRTKPEPAMIRLALELLKEARNLRFDSRSHLLQRYRTESANHVHRLERLQKYALRLGILGTFVGLMLALASFGAILSATPSEASQAGANAQHLLFDAGSRDLLNSLKLSFGTSIAGLAASLFIAAQAELVRRRQLRCFRHMEDASLSLVTLAGRTLHREDLLASLEDNTRAMKDLQAQVYDQTRKLEEALAGLDQRIAGQTHEIEAGMIRLAEARQRLDGILQQIEVSHSRFLVNLSESLERLSARLDKAFGGLGKGLAAELQARATQVVGRFDELLLRIGASHKKFITDLTALFEQASLDQLVKRLPESVVGLGERLASDVGSGFVRLGRQFEGLRDTVAAVERDLAGSAQDLAGKASSLQSAVQSIDSQVTAAAAESRRTMKEVPPALETIRRKLESARTGGLVVLDAAIFKKTLLAGCVGLLPGALVGNTLLALAGVIVGPGLFLAFSGMGGAR